MKLTKKERREFMQVLASWYTVVGNEWKFSVRASINKSVLDYLGEKKKQWQEEAIRNFLEGETEDALCLD